MRNFKSNVRNILRALLVLIITLLCVLPNTGCFTDGKFQKGSINFNLYSSDKDMNRLISDLSCDTASMTLGNGNISRLAHNNGEPIYVSFDQCVSEDMKNASIQTLDYIFGLVNNINNLYFYEIVEYDRYVSTKSNIRYTMYDENESDVKNASAYVLRTSYGKFYATNTVYINSSLENRSSNYINYVLTHELLHIFGFEDVYLNGEVKNTNDYFDNTFLNVSDIYINSGLISPNDYKFLLCAYTPRDSYTNYNSVLAEYFDLIDYYSTEFFDTIASKTLSNQINKICDTHIDSEIELSLNTGEKYVLSANGDEYSMSIIINDLEQERLTGKLKYIKIGDDNKTIVVLTNINSKYLGSCGQFCDSEAVHTNLILYNEVTASAQSAYCLSKLTGGQLIKSFI